MNISTIARKRAEELREFDQNIKEGWDDDMTPEQIKQKRARLCVKYDVAIEVRRMLDAAKKKYGAADWDDDDLDTEIYELVREDG